MFMVGVYIFSLLFCIGFGLSGVIRSTHGDGRTEFILSGICLMVFIIMTIIINIEDRQTKKKNKEKAEEEEKRAKEKEAQQRMENSAKEKQKFNNFLKYAQITSETDFDDDETFWAIKKKADSRKIAYDNFNEFIMRCKNGPEEYSDAEKKYLDAKKRESEWKKAQKERAEDLIDEELYRNMANQTRAKSHLLDLIGNEKSIHMLMEKREEVLSKMCDADKRMYSYNEATKQALMSSAVLYSSLKEKENDSALFGGMAAGIAGTSFGAATYLNEEGQNQRIRERNSYLQNQSTQATSKIISSAVKTKKELQTEKSKIQQKIADIDEEIKHCGKKVVDTSVPSEELFEKINVESQDLFVSKFGSIIVQIKIKADKEILIRGRAGAVDGTIKAVIRNGNKIICELPFVLPLYGIPKNKRCSLSSATLNVGKYEDMDNYTCSIEGRNLWLVETDEKYHKSSKRSQSTSQSNRTQRVVK